MAAPFQPDRNDDSAVIDFFHHNKMLNSRYNLLSTTRMCYLDNPRLQFNKEPPKLLDPLLQKLNMTRFRYLCAGTTYTSFAVGNLFPFIRRRQSESSTWGTRPTIVPDTGTNKTILMMGNSHTRQVFNTFMCQHRDQVVFRNQTWPRYCEGGFKATLSIGPNSYLHIFGLPTLLLSTVQTGKTIWRLSLNDHWEIFMPL